MKYMRKDAQHIADTNRLICLSICVTYTGNTRSTFAMVAACLVQLWRGAMNSPPPRSLASPLRSATPPPPALARDRSYESPMASSLSVSTPVRESARSPSSVSDRGVSFCFACLLLLTLPTSLSCLVLALFSLMVHKRAPYNPMQTSVCRYVLC
jgi:hypothetical protein